MMSKLAMCMSVQFLMMEVVLFIYCVLLFYIFGSRII